MNVWKKSGLKSDKELVDKTLGYRKGVAAIFEDVFKWKQDDIKTRYTIPKDFNCMRQMVDSYQKACGSWDYYSASYMSGVINVCEN